MTSRLDSTKRTDNRVVGRWLLLCCALVFAMVVLGGVTRLTGSGLSMVRWQPLSGVIPPISAKAWEVEFQHYQTSPEFKKINRHLLLDEFKTIFYFEYAHRMLGRMIGLAFLLPLLYLVWRRRIRRQLVPRLVVLFILGGLQGLLGWYMVKSGLVDIPRVSPYRLTAHLVAAVAIYGYMFWVALDLLHNRTSEPGVSRVAGMASMAAFMVLVTMLSGGFVAGLKAGHAFNSFPLMAGKWLPPGYLAAEPAWRNFFETIPTVQFNHRWLAIATFVLVLVFVARGWQDATLARYRRVLALFAGVASVQVVLGISTLLLHVPVILGAAHQGCALVLFTVALYLTFVSRHTAAGET